MLKQRCLITLSLLILLFTQSFATNQKKDSLVNQDSLAIQFQKKIKDASGDSLQLIEAYYNYGEYYNNQGIADSSIIQFSKALRVAKNIENDEKIALIANMLANAYWITGNFNSSTQSYEIGLTSAENLRDSSSIAKISMNMASNYNFLGEYEKAIKFALHALKIKESSNDYERICYHYISMGNIFRENNNNKKWEEYVKKAYKLKDVEGCASFTDIAKIYNSLGGIAVQKEEFDKGLLYYDTLKTLCNENSYNQGISTALMNSAGIYKQLGDFEKAIELSSEAEKYFGNNPYDRFFSNNFKAELYQILGRNKEALDLAKKNIQKDDIQYYSTEKLKSLTLLYELNLNLSNYKEAFIWNDSLRVYENWLRDEDVRQTFEELETKYETEKKVQQIELLTTENQLKNQRLNAGLAIVTVLLIIIFLISYILRIRKKQAIFAQNDLQQQVLRSQMNPHFIFNVLGSIQNFMMQNDTKKASNYLSQFASLTRSTLNNSAAETIPLADEISMLKNYIELEKMRSKDKFEYEIIYDDDLEADFIQIPPMLIQPFIENSIKHGFKNLNRTGFLKLQITDKTDNIVVIIEDNGHGIQQKYEKENKHQSMAMNIFEKRRKLIQQKYNKEFEFEIQNLKNTNPKLSGVKITINIPILNND